MWWWAELCPPGEAPKVQYGGSTGMYTIVVLLSWWCTLLKGKPEGEHAECLQTLEDVDHVLVATIDDLEKNPITSTAPPPTPTAPPPTTPPTRSRSRKRANTEVSTSRKRARRSVRA